MIKNPFGKMCQTAGLGMSALSTALLVGMVVSPAPVSAQLLDQCEAVAGEGYKCSYEYMDNQIQKVPGFFKFQSRISQAKLPVGDVVFNTIYVNLKSGTETLCTEEFSNVPVRDSVLNLEIGHTMDCALDMKIAESNAIQLQVCIGSTENCLKPVEFSSVPFAIKASYAREAQIANEANEAVQCHYAHLITADRDLFNNPTIGTGFYDFHTPAEEQVANLINLWDSAMSVPFSSSEMNAMTKGGYIQWNQVDPAYGSNLHICSQVVDSTNNDPGRLTSLIFHAEVTNSLGQMVVWGYPEYDADTDTGEQNTPRGLISKAGSSLFGHTYFDHNMTAGIPNSTKSERQLDTGRFAFTSNHNTFTRGDATFSNDVFIGDSGTKATRGGGHSIESRNYLRQYGEADFFHNTWFTTETHETNVNKVEIDDKLVVDGNSYLTNDVYMGDINVASDGTITKTQNVDANLVEIDDSLTVDGTARFNNDVYLGAEGIRNANTVYLTDSLQLMGTTTVNANVTFEAFTESFAIASLYIESFYFEVSSSSFIIESSPIFKNGAYFENNGGLLDVDVTTHLRGPLWWTEKLGPGDISGASNATLANTGWNLPFWSVDSPGLLIWAVPKSGPWTTRSYDDNNVEVDITVMFPGATGSTIEFDTELTMHFKGWGGTSFTVNDPRTTTIPNAQWGVLYQIHHVIEIDNASIPSNAAEKGHEEFRFTWDGGTNVTTANVMTVEVSQYR